MFESLQFSRRTLAVLPFALLTLPAFAVEEGLTAAAQGRDPLFLTISNGANNYLVSVNTRTKETTFTPTGGRGGVSGNAGGVAVEGRLAAAVNFGSGTVTVFQRRGDAMQPIQTIKTASAPVSVAFGKNHLLVLGQTSAESFPVYGNSVSAQADGAVDLLKGDKSAAQILAYDGGAVYSEKSGAIGLLNLSNDSAPGLSGPGRSVLLPPAPNNDTPFGMIARGANIYASIAHSDLQLLIVNGQVLSSAVGPTPFTNGTGGFTHAPCWNTLWGQFLYSADSPGKQLLRYLVSDANVFYDKPAVARFAGPPTDLTALDNIMGVIDGGDGQSSNASIFDVNSEGELNLRFAVKLAGPINGAALIR